MKRQRKREKGGEGRGEKENKVAISDIKSGVKISR